MRARIIVLTLSLTAACSTQEAPDEKSAEGKKVIVKAEPVGSPAVPLVSSLPLPGESSSAAPHEGSSVEPGTSSPAVPHERSLALPESEPEAVAVGGAPPGPVDGVLPDFARTYELTAPSVVKIRAVGPAGTKSGAASPPPGSGFFFGRAGEILTNAHQVAGAVGFEVETFDGRKARARLIGQDPLTDVALLATELVDPPPPLPAAPRESLRQGNWVLAIGNPLGLEFSATRGIISALNRTDVLWDGVGYYDFIQTDAAINRGSAGGPLVDPGGLVVGICAALEADAKRIGYAIPISTAEVVADHLRSYGKLRRAWLGIQILRVEGQIVVVGVFPDSPGHVAGLEPDDVILQLDGEVAEDVQQLRWKIAIHDVDSPALLKVFREGRVYDIAANLEVVEDRMDSR
jgi:S1-C subfamily serine protease